MYIDSYSYTNCGRYEINEDSVLCAGNVFAVADGLGGRDGGETASACAVDYIRDNYSGCSDGELEALIAGANRAVLGLGNGACTTIAAVFAEGGTIRFTNIGDSRVYYFRSGKLLMRTKDHSVCQAAVEAGSMPEEDIRGNDDRSKLLKVLGNSAEMKTGRLLGPDRIQDGDAFIVCSDGFWEYVYETEMEIDFLKSGDPAQWAEYMLRRHLKRSRCEGDNFSVICGIIHSDEPVEKHTEKNETPEGRKSALLPIIIIGAFLIAAALAFAWFINRPDSSGPTAGTEQTGTEGGSVGETGESTGQTEETGETGENTGQTEETGESTGQTEETGETRGSVGQTEEGTGENGGSAGQTQEEAGETRGDTGETATMALPILTSK